MRGLIAAGVLAAASAAQIVAPAPVSAQSVVSIDLPAGRLDAALRALSRQAGVSIAGTERGISSTRVGAVCGTMTAAEALRRLLVGTPFVARQVNARTFRIERRPRSAAQARNSAGQAPAPAPPVIHPPIIVTGTKRDIDARDYPGGLSVVRPAERSTPSAQMQGLDAALAEVPVASGTALGPGRNKIFIRGVADSSFNGPTQSTVGIYLGEQRLVFSAPNPDLRLYDIDQVELLEGPQGTLYGTGAIGGLVRLTPRRPNVDAAAASFWQANTLTEHGRPSAEFGGLANLPLGKGVALRALAYGGEAGGYIDDPGRRLRNVNRTAHWGGRAMLRAPLAPRWTLEAVAFGQETRMDDGQYVRSALPGLARTSRIAQPFRGRIYGGNVTLRGWLGDVELTSATGLTDHMLDTTYDSSILVPGPARQAFSEVRKIRLLSHETRLAHDNPEGVGWLLGASLLRNRDETRQLFTSLDGNSPPPFARITYRLDEAALFGEASVPLAPRWALSLGGRLATTNSSGERSFGPDTVIEPREGPARFLPLAALSWKPTPGLIAFVRYQQGYRTGGVAIERQPNGDPLAVRFDPDRVQSYEVGVRATAGGEDEARFEFNAFRVDWRDIQADLIEARGFPITRNIGDGSNFGVSAKLDVVLRGGWSFAASALGNHSHVDRLLPGGGIAQNSLPNVPSWAGTAGVARDWMLDDGATLSAGLRGRYVGRSFIDLDQQVRVPQGDYGSIDAEVAYRRDGFELALELLNITDTQGNRFAFGNPFTARNERQEVPLRPRSVRLSLRADF